MHSNIYQFADAPISKESYLGALTLEEDTNMLWGRADYFNEDTDRDVDIENLVELLKAGGMENLEFDKETSKITFTHKDLERWFDEKLHTIKKIINELEDAFVDKKTEGINIPRGIYRLNEVANDKYGYYVAYEGCWTLDEFLMERFREYNAKDTYEFYIGATIDYHS